jgi:hypothetical protein
MRTLVILEKFDQNGNIVIEKGFSALMAQKVLNDPALKKQWRKKLEPRKESRTVVATEPEPIVPTVTPEAKAKETPIAQAETKSHFELIKEIKQSEDIGFLQEQLNDSRKSVKEAAKKRLKELK